MTDQADTKPDAADPNEPVTITLRKPITIGTNEPVTEFKVRPMKGKDLRHMPAKDGYPMVSVMWLAGKLSGQTNRVIDELEGADLNEVVEVVNGFLAGTQQGTGDESSES